MVAPEFDCDTSPSVCDIGMSEPLGMGTDRVGMQYRCGYGWGLLSRRMHVQSHPHQSVTQEKSNDAHCQHGSRPTSLDLTHRREHILGHVIIATWTAREGEADYVRSILEKMTRGNRAEEKSVHFQAQVSNDDPNTFVVYEHYTDATGYEEHRASEPFRTLVLGEVIPRLQSRSVTTFTTVGDEA